MADIVSTLFKKKQPNQKVSQQSQSRIKKTTQKTLAFIDGYENGTLQVEPSRFSRSIELEDISFKTRSNEEQEEIFANYLKLLNSITPEEDVYFSFVNYKDNTKATLSSILPELTGDKYDEYRKENINMLKQKMSKGRNNIRTRKIATIVTNSRDVDGAMTRLDEMETEFINSYKRITKTTAHTMNLAKRMDLFDRIMNGSRINPYILHDISGNPSLDIKLMGKHNRKLKDIIAPEAFKFYGNNFEINDRFGQVMYLDGIANWLNTNFISELSSTNFEGVITIHIEAIPQQVAVKKMKDISVNINAEIIQKTKDNDSGYIPTDLRNISQQVDELQEDILNRDQKLFYMTMNILHFAPDKDTIKEQSKIITNIANKYMCRIQPLFMQQERGLSSALPIGIDLTYSKRLMTTESMGVFIPFDEVNTMDEGGFYYGTNTINKSLIIYNRLKGQNYNGLILGSSGSGKSFSAKREMINAFLTTNADICIIDPDGEYTPLAENFDGSIIKIAPGSNVYINPFDLDMDMSQDPDNNPLTMKIDFICGIIETMLGERAKLSPTQRAIVGRCINNMYKPYLEHLNNLPPKDGKPVTIDKAYCPTMQSLFDELSSQPQYEAQELSFAMEPYVTGVFDTFAYRTSPEVDINNRIVVYDIKNIGTNLRELALKVCMNDVWNKMMANKRQNKWTWFYIDEFHLLMKNDATSEFLKSVWKRARKWQGVPTGITQNVEDLLESSEARAIINNSSFVYMMNQSKMDRDMLAQLLGLTENDVEYITNAEIGSGLIYTGKQTIPFTDHFPTDTKLYKVMTTKPDDT